jgi:DNA repair protein RadC
MRTPTQSTIWSHSARPRSLAERPLAEWPLRERPTERLCEAGPAALSEAELLALVLGATGKTNPITLAGELLVQSGGWVGLQRLTLEEIAEIPGMNRARAARIKAALEIGRRLVIASAETRPQIRSPADVAQLLMIEMGHLDQEQLRVILLETKNRVQKVHTVYIGTLNSSNVRVAEVFKEAIRLNAAAIVIAHNHPSNQPDPSPEDVLITRQLVDAGKLLDIEVMDHLVICRTSYVSLRERGLGFPR